MARPRARLYLVAASACVLVACGPGDEPTDAAASGPSPVVEPTDAGTSAPAPEGFSLRGYRYCEILLTFEREGGPVTEVWGTPGLSRCPAAAWGALSPEEIAAEYGAASIVMNGVRHFVADSPVETDPAGERDVTPRRGERRTYGELEMRLLAEVELGADPVAYQPKVVHRTTTWSFRAGSEIYVLTDADGARYVMQSYAQIVDPTLDESDLVALGGRLALPDGWSYEARTLDAELVVQLPRPGEAIVVQDDLANTYQLMPTDPVPPG